MTLYLIDDDKTIQFLLKIQLSGAGYELEAFDNVFSFEEFFTQNIEAFEGSIIFMDINLPNEDGDVFVNRSADVFASVPGLRIVFLTDNPDSIKPSELLKEKISFSPKNHVSEWLEKNG